LETRRLDALTREKAVDGRPVNTKDASDADCIEPAVVNQPPDRLGMHAELIRDFTDTHEAYGIFVCRPHDLW
jgi:hypothetical protein